MKTLTILGSDIVAMRYFVATMENPIMHLHEVLIKFQNFSAFLEAGDGFTMGKLTLPYSGSVPGKIYSEEFKDSFRKYLLPTDWLKKIKKTDILTISNDMVSLNGEDPVSLRDGFRYLSTEKKYQYCISRSEPQVIGEYCPSELIKFSKFARARNETLLSLFPRLHQNGDKLARVWFSHMPEFEGMVTPLVFDH